MNYAQLGTTLLVSFLASLVECVEALTVVLAVGSVRGWGPAMAGAVAALATLGILVALLGPSLALLPIDALQVIVGILLLLFGLRWLRKAILRAAGVIPLHDEAASYAKNRTAMQNAKATQGWDRIAFGTAFNITMLEGIEVVFIVVAIGAAGAPALTAASLGAGIALLLVVALGLALHRPLSRIPENALKFTVGVLISAFGTFLTGEGIGLFWPAGDWFLPVLMAAYLAAAAALVPICERRIPGAVPLTPSNPKKSTL